MNMGADEFVFVVGHGALSFLKVTFLVEKYHLLYAESWEQVFGQKKKEYLL